MDAPIKYCYNRKSFYYVYACKLNLGYVKKEQIRGGLKKNLWINENFY